MSLDFIPIFYFLPFLTHFLAFPDASICYSTDLKKNFSEFMSGKSKDIDLIWICCAGRENYIDQAKAKLNYGLTKNYFALYNDRINGGDGGDH